MFKNQRLSIILVFCMTIFAVLALLLNIKSLNTAYDLSVHTNYQLVICVAIVLICASIKSILHILGNFKASTTHTLCDIF